MLAVTLALSMLGASVAQARSVVAPERGAQAPVRDEPWRFFGGQTVEMPVPLFPSFAGRLRGQLFERASAVARPIGPRVEVGVDGAGGEAGWPPRLDVALPSVRQPADFELRVEIRPESADAWHSAGRMPLRLYPEDLLAPLRRFSESHRIRVVEDHGELGAFLREQQIAFTSRGDAPRPAKGPGVTLYAGASAERAAREPTPSPGDIVIFRERQPGLPHLAIEEHGPGSRITVEMQLLRRLSSDPRAQQTFVEIFELLEARRTRGDMP